MAKQIVQNVKGTRDFYPEDLVFREWLYGKIKQISGRFGYQEFDGPQIEYLELYTDKTSQEILSEQTFGLKDRDDRSLVLRPEITPTFARMVAQKGPQLAKPIRWWSFGRAWRYEQPQKGRGREFFQWEVNLLGPENPEADAEILAMAAQFLKLIGLKPEEVVIRVSDRSYFEQILDEAGISRLLYMPLLRLIDRIEKVSEAEFTKALVDDLKLTPEQLKAILNFIKNKDFSGSKWLTGVFNSLEAYPGATDYIEYDPVITRGFDYYTRTVFEAWDRTGGLKRAMFGGGRFDNLTETLGGERIPGVGMAPGDMPLEEILRQFGKLPELKPKAAKVLVSVFSPEMLTKSVELGSRLRSNGIDVETWLEGDVKLEKQLKYADQKGIQYVAIVGPDELARGQVMLKDLNGRSQESLSFEELFEKLSKI